MLTTDTTHIRPIRALDAERIYARSLAFHEAQKAGAGQKGYRAARDRNGTLLRGLERCAEVMEALEEHQRGRTRRTATDANRAQSHEASIFREAFRCADSGNATAVYAYVYAAVAEYVGVIEHQGR